MMSRKELEMILGCKFTDEEWAANQKMLDDLAERQWDEDHPMDE